MKLKNPKEFEPNMVKTLFIVCASVLSGYWNKKPIPNVETLNNKERKDWLKKIFEKIETQEELQKKFCKACDIQNIAIPFA